MYLFTIARLKQYYACIACNLSIMACGVCFTWLEPLTLRMSEPGSDIYMSKEDVSWLVAIVELGAILGSVISGWLADRFGRKMILLTTCPIFAASWLMVLFAWNRPILYIVRLVQGVAFAFSFAIAPMYIAEMAEPQIRGQLSGHFQTSWYMGILFVYVVGKWTTLKLYLSLCLVINIVFAIAFVFVPESPYYYVMKGEDGKASSALSWYRSGMDIREEFEELKTAVNSDMTNKGGWRDIFATRKDTKSFLFVQLVCITRYMSGMPALVNYATETFAEDSGGLFTKDQLTIALGILFTFIAVLSAFLSDSFGRRKLLITSAFGCAVFNLLIGLYYYMYQVEKMNVTPYSWILYTGLVGFCFFSDLGLGSLMQTLQAELFPSNTRALVGGITGVTGAVASFANLKLYQPISAYIGVYFNFMTYSLVALIGAILICIYASETAGKSLAQIQEDLKSNDGRNNANVNETPA